MVNFNCASRDITPTATVQIKNVYGNLKVTILWCVIYLLICSSPMCACVRVYACERACVCECMYVHVYVFVRVYLCVRACMCVRARACACVHVRACACVRARACMCEWVRVCMCVCPCACVRACACACVSMCMWLTILQHRCSHSCNTLVTYTCCNLILLLVYGQHSFLFIHDNKLQAQIQLQTWIDKNIEQNGTHWDAKNVCHTQWV